MLDLNIRGRLLIVRGHDHSTVRVVAEDITLLRAYDEADSVLDEVRSIPSVYDGWSGASIAFVPSNIESPSSDRDYLWYDTNGPSVFYNPHEDMVGIDRRGSLHELDLDDD